MGQPALLFFLFYSEGWLENVSKDSLGISHFSLLFVYLFTGMPEHYSPKIQGREHWRGESPHFFLPSSYFRGSRPRAAPRSSDFSVSTARTPSPPFLGRRHSRRPKFG